jgi:DNA-binding winged helix-turn-helix (wHTH) protein/Tfp pilus assembly protein PilF
MNTHSSPPDGKVRFGLFEVDVRAGELRKSGIKIKLYGQAFEILLALLERPGEAVTREELRQRLWPPDVFVDVEVGLNKAVNHLREALGDTAEDSRYVETLPRRGYRFIASVSSDDRKKRTNSAVGWKIAVVVAVVVVAATVAGGLSWHSRRARRLTEKDTIVLADFANTTGDAVFDETLKQGLRVQLEQSPFLNILSEQKVSEELQMMGRQKDERLTLDLAREVCQRMGTKAILTGSISSLGAHYAIGMNALNCQTGDSLASEQVEVDSREHVLRALGESATKMREKLGESLKSIQRFDAPIEQVTTPSLQALRAYSLGLSAETNAATIPFLKRAVELDPNFAMAYAKLGVVYGDDGNTALSSENERKAYELRGKVTERERLYIEGHYYDYLTGELEKAASVWEVMRQTYPRDPVSYRNLNWVYRQFGNYEKALELARGQLRVKTDHEGEDYAMVGLCYIYLNRLDEAAAVYKQAEELHLEDDMLLYGRYSLAFLKNDTGEMQRLVATYAGKPFAGDLRIWEGWAEASHGRLRKARALFQPETPGGCEVCTNTYLGLLEAYYGYVQQARADADAFLKLPQSGRNERVALTLAVAGDATRAEKLAAELDKGAPLDWDVQRFWLPTIRAAIALQRRNPEMAVELLRVAGPYELGAQCLRPVYERGKAYLMLREGSAAAAEFQKMVDHPGIMEKCPLGALAHLQLARAYAMQGDTAKARTKYQDFLTLWKDADPDIPILKQAKVEYAKLQ